MLTRQGAGVLAGSVALYLAGVLLGYVEPLVLAAGGLTVVVLSLAWIVRRPALDVRRRVEPSRVTKGDPAFGAVTVANPTRWMSPVATAVEPFGHRSLAVDIPRLGSGQSIAKRYRLPTDRRGVVDVGPLRITRGDPLALWQVVQRTGALDRLWVHPVVHVLRGLPVGRTRSLDGRSSDQVAHGRITFHALRDYVIGDDLRLVHWRSSARTGTLLVRENVDTSLPQLTVVLDTRAAVHEDDGFEHAVEAAASVVVAATAARYPVRLVTTCGRALGGRGVSADARGFLDLLSEVGRTDDGDVRRLVAALAVERRSDALVAVTGQAGPDDLTALGALARRYDDAVIALVARHAETAEVPRGISAAIVRAGSGEEFARRWNQVMTR